MAKIPGGLTRKVALTDRSLKALKPAPAGKRLTVWDARMPGMAVRITDKGAVSFFAVRRRAGATSPSWVKLGTYPPLTLAEARDNARDALGALLDGKHPRTIAEEKRREEASQQAGNFGTVAQDFAQRLETGKIHKANRGGGPLRNAKEVATVVRREFLGQERDGKEWKTSKRAPWTERPIGDISRRDVREAIEAIVEDRGLYAGRHAFAAARRLFKWAVQRDLIERSPCEGLSAVELHGAPTSRDRVLSDNELRLVWRVADATSYPFGDLVKLLLLTGQRLNEVGQLRWIEIEGDLMTIPAERMKGGIAQTVPLVLKASEILKGIPHFASNEAGKENGEKFVFSTTGGGTAIAGYSYWKRTFDASISKVAKETGETPMPPWTLHDLRRTVRTRLSSLGVLPVIAELCIGHKQQGIAAVYDLHRYDSEKRDAMRKWEALLLTIVAPQPPPGKKVVELHTRASA